MSEGMEGGRRPDLAVVLPVYEDGEALNRTLRELDEALTAEHGQVVVVVVDDGSRMPVKVSLRQDEVSTIRDVVVLRLRSNLGHQRAIAVGLTYVYAEVQAKAVLVMDADGQDRPEDAVRLLTRLGENGGDAMVFAWRARRTEGLFFRVFYRVYQALARILTGVGVRVGNFSVIPAAQLERLMVTPDLWNHYAAAAFNARVPYETVPTRRGTRHAGRSSMNFVALVTHGLSAISVFSAVVGVRLLLASLAASSAIVVAALSLLAARFVAGVPVSNGSALLTGLAVLFLSQMSVLSFGAVFFILSGRDRLSFIPIRDYAFFIQSARKTQFRER